MSGTPGRLPPAVVCYICGRQYGTKSIDIHIKQCQKKFLQQEAQKPKAQRRPLPRPPSTFQTTADGDQGSPGGRPQTAPQGNLAAAWSPVDLQAHNEAAMKTFNEESMARCENWLAVHQRSCTSERAAKSIDQTKRGGGTGGAVGAKAVYSPPRPSTSSNGRTPSSNQRSRPLSSSAGASSLRSLKQQPVHKNSGNEELSTGKKEFIPSNISESRSEAPTARNETGASPNGTDSQKDKLWSFVEVIEGRLENGEKTLVQLARQLRETREAVNSLKEMIQ